MLLQEMLESIKLHYSFQQHVCINTSPSIVLNTKIKQSWQDSYFTIATKKNSDSVAVGR
jgi:hypothetical protein